MTILKNNTEKIGINQFQNDTLSFEELQELDKIKKNMLKGDYHTFNEIFHAV